MALGPNDLKQWALPPGWDAARLMQYQLSSGESYDDLVNDITDGTGDRQCSSFCVIRSSRRW